MSAGADRGLLAAGVLAMAAPIMARDVTLLDFGDLPGWAGDDHVSALAVFRATCGQVTGPGWAEVAAQAGTVAPDAARRFFEAVFRPVLLADGTPPLFTGYYEPELPGALEPDARFRVPLYARPPELPEGHPWLSRAEIEDGALAGRGLELAFVEEPVEAFLMQVQGSGRLRLPDGRVMRLGYAGKNGRPYTSVGRVLAERGLSGVTSDVIRDWVRAHPADGRAMLRLNESFVFFHEVEGLPPEAGPIGTMGRPVTALRSVAVDPAQVPLGAPVWVEVGGAEPLRRLMVAQDTGGAIRGAQRADLFFGTGEEAGRRAARLKAGGRMVVLWPAAQAAALAGWAAP